MKSISQLMKHNITNTNVSAHLCNFIPLHLKYVCIIPCMTGVFPF